MDVEHMAWCRGKSILFLLLIFLPTGYFEPSKWTDHMEDAFAEETLTDGTCKRNTNDKLIFCRYQVEEKKSLSSLNPCLCTHILFPVDPNAPKIEISQSLKNRNADLKLIASVSFDAIDLLNVSSVHQGLLGFSNSSVDGVDVQIKQVDYVDETAKHKFLESVQNTVSKLKAEVKSLILSFTVTGTASSLLNDSQFQSMWSYIDFLSFDPSFMYHDSKRLSNAHLDLTHTVDLALERGFPRSKLLLPVSLRLSLEQIMNETFSDEMYPKVCNYINDAENKNSSVHQQTGRNSNIMDVFGNQVQFALNKDVGGIDIWSLNDDDVNNTCGKKPYPITKEISHNIKGGKDLFGSFTDLDITLSTGESQITEEIQVLHEQNTDAEEMRKFKCERIGFYRHPTDCTKFYHCADYRATTAQPVNQHAIFVYKCPRGLVYDEHQGSCNWPSYSEPCEGSDELMPVPPKKFKCSTPGFHADPLDCRWFYYCSDLGDGKLAAFQFQCPADHLGFDEKNLLCNWKWMVPICGVKRQDNDQSTSERSNIEANSGVRNRLSKNLHLGDLQPESLPLSVISATSPSKETRSISTNSRKLNQTRTNSSRPDQLESKASSTLDLDDILKRWAASFVNYTDERIQRPGAQEFKVMNKTNTNEYVNGNPREKSEKKYGTAYWHRSMANSRPRHRIPSYAFDVPIGNRRSSVVEYDDDTNFEGRHQSENTQTEQKYGIGSVRKLNLRPEEVRRLNRGAQGLSIERELTHNFAQNSASLHYDKPFSKDEESNVDTLTDKINDSDITRGRSLGENVVTNYQFDGSKDLRKNPPNGNSFARVKCSKMIDENDPGASNENVFGCTSEVSLFVRMKEGNEFSKYVLKEDKLTNAAHQESKQVKFLENDPGITKNLKSRNHQLKDAVEQTSKQTNESKNQNNLENASTQGRSLGNNHRSEISYQIIAPLKPQSTNQKRHIEDQQQNLSLINFESEISSTNKDVLNKSSLANFLPENDLQNLYQRNSQREKETTSENSKNNFMPISFYPQGVLLNVDLNHINEIPPQILLEVDIMLKKFMTDGDIDLKLLMKKLNATMEHMPEKEMKANMTSSKVDSMLNVLENILNTTDVMISQREDSTATVTDEIQSNSEASSASDNYVNSTADDLAYENITNILSTISNNDTTHNTDISASTVNSENNSTNPTVRKSEKSIQTEEVIVQKIPENKPFVRRRLFRKYRYPSIREQLEIQKLISSHSSSTELPISHKTTEASSVTPSRRRYPSIREQLLWNNKNVAFDDSRGFLLNERGDIQSHTVAYNVQDAHHVWNANEKFGDRIRSTNNDARYQTNNRWASQSANEGPNYKHSDVRLPENKTLPNSDSRKQFQDHNSRYDDNRWASLPTNVETAHKNSGVRFPENIAPPASGTNLEFGDHNSKYNSKRLTSSPGKNEPDYKNSGVRLPERISPPSSGVGLQFQIHSSRHEENSWASIPFNYESNHRYSDVNLPKNTVSPGFSSGVQFQDPNSKYEGNRRTSLPSGNEPYHRNSGVRLPENTIPTRFDTVRQFQINNSRSDSNRWPSLPANDAFDIRYPDVKLPDRETDIPNSNTGSYFRVPYSGYDSDKWTTLTAFEERDYRNREIILPKNVESPRGTQIHVNNARNNNLSPDLQSKDARNSHSPTNQGRSLQRRLQNPSRNASRFRYTLPLPPIQYSTENPPNIRQDIPVSESNSFNQYDDRYSNEENSNNRRRNTSSTTQRSRKSRKLKILVKKLPNAERNGENGSHPQINTDSNAGMKIPKKLLNELRTNLIRKLSVNGKSDVELEIQFQDHVWNIPFVNNQSSVDISPVACTRAGLFQHPKDCNMFYECFWDKWLKRFTLHVFSCPVRLVYDENIRGCTRPSFESTCRNSV
ncbi:uncharacterized protein NPIL_328671 [Nephila pilipes]|uniref:Chitin-binding type-2 domain-containing protein n=1 Tax=Nephila pilipes TaxID=299642 RepID=A0A8X6PLC3_NEPPI|nr:uncharacterized protein NPIL_328671 [Nephila pilipes]